MTERAAIVLSALAGAAIGSLAGYLFLTEGGRRLRAEWEPALEGMLRNAAALRNTVERAGVAASEGWASAGEDSQEPRWPDGGQPAPF